MTLDVITLRDSPAAGGGILDLASPFPPGSQWTRGVSGIGTAACLAAGTHIFCNDDRESPAEKTYQSLDSFSFSPYGVEVSVICSNLGVTQEAIDRAQAAVGVRAEMVVGQELAMGAAGIGNPSLADAVSVGAAPTVVGALAMIEAVVALGLGGHLAWIHVAPSDLVLLAASDAIWRDLAGWRTPTGNVVVSSPGYQASQSGIMVATTPVTAEVSSVDQTTAQDHQANRLMATFESATLAVFDPCFNVSVDFPGAFTPISSPASP